MYTQNKYTHMHVFRYIYIYIYIYITVFRQPLSGRSALLKLDTRFSIEHFEPAVSRSTVSSLPSCHRVDRPRENMV